MSVTLIAYPTATFIDDLTAWNNFNTRADADGADTKEDACFDCLYLRFAGLNAMPELAYVLDTMGGTDIAVTYRRCKAVKSYDNGLLQINSTWVTVTAQVCKTKRGDLTVLLIPDCNVRVAKYLYEQGGGINNWRATSGKGSHD